MRAPERHIAAQVLRDMSVSSLVRAAESMIPEPWVVKALRAGPVDRLGLFLSHGGRPVALLRVASEPPVIISVGHDGDEPDASWWPDAPVTLEPVDCPLPTGHASSSR